MGDREVRKSRGGMEGMDSPIGNWSPDKPVIRKSLSRASKEQRAGYSSFIRYVQRGPWVVILILRKETFHNANTFQEVSFHLFPHLFRRPVNFFFFLLL